MSEKDKEITIKRKNYDAAYAIADESMRKVLKALLGEETATDKPEPTLKDYTTIRSYEDACVALGIQPILNNQNLFVVNQNGNEDEVMPKHIVALMKLEVICKALWGGEVKVYPDAEGNRIYWYPWFALYTKDEIESMNENDRRALLSACANGGADAGFGCLGAGSRSSLARANVGFRLCLDTEEKAKYFGVTFIDLWAEYLAYNFTVGGHIE